MLLLFEKLLYYFFVYLQIEISAILLGKYKYSFIPPNEIREIDDDTSKVIQIYLIIKEKKSIVTA